MSNRTTSPSSSLAQTWASVPPIMPDPIRAIFARAIRQSPRGSPGAEKAARGLDRRRRPCKARPCSSLDPAFLATSEALTSLALCEARLQLDARFAWIVLIPRLDGKVELEDLTTEEGAMLLSEVVVAGQAVRAIGAALGRPVEKLNVGQLGNLTRQLHVHVVGRRRDDPCWPGPVWGQGTAERLQRGGARRRKAAALTILADGG